MNQHGKLRRIPSKLVSQGFYDQSKNNNLQAYNISLGVLSRGTSRD